MQLFRCRIAGHFVLKNTGWFTVAKKATLIGGEQGRGKTTLLKALRSINPPFCHHEPFPFESFPQYIQNGRYTRKVMPEKKTAVLALFSCDKVLRDELEKIDPVYLETDQIEVGRKLDCSKWITFVDIASSSRWSELSPTIARLREVFADAVTAVEVADIWQECLMIDPTDRVKEDLADRLNGLLAYLESQPPRKQGRELIDQARFLVNRAARFRQAREAVNAVLPVFVYLEKSVLLSAIIDVEKIAEKLRCPEEISNICPDLFFLELLGIDHHFLSHADNDEIRRHLEENKDYYHQKTKQLNENLTQHLKTLDSSFSLSVGGGPVRLKNDDDQEDSSEHNSVTLLHRWLMSCAISVAYIQNFKRRDLILLLDEPDAGLEQGEKTKLAAMLAELSKTYQLVLCSTAADLLGENAKRYRLAQEREDVPGSIIY